MTLPGQEGARPPVSVSQLGTGDHPGKAIHQHLGIALSQDVSAGKRLYRTVKVRNSLSITVFPLAGRKLIL